VICCVVIEAALRILTSPTPRNEGPSQQTLTFSAMQAQKQNQEFRPNAH
jgi:hypothetical protein